MSFRKSFLAVAGICAALITSIPYASNAQEPPRPLRETQVATEVFKLDDRIPAWVDEIAMPAIDQSLPLQIRLLDTQYHLDNVKKVYTRRAVTVNTVSALNNAGQLEIRFVPQYQQVSLHTLRIHRGGETLDLRADASIRFLQRERDLERGVYSGEVTASILVNDLRVGDTLELAYSVQGQNPVFGGIFADIASWDQTLPTRLRRVVLTHPEARNVRWQVIGDPSLGKLEPKETVENGMRRVEFMADSMTEIAPDSSLPANYDPLRWIQISEFQSWSELARWASQLFAPPTQYSSELRAVAAKLRQLPDVEDRIEGALRFVQNEIRYFSVSLGESSHRPATPRTVLSRRYGDCKDKSLLLITLLHQLGIDAAPVLLQSGSRRRMDAMLPSPQLFDHAIVQVQVNGATYYVDPTRLSQHGRLATMGQAHEGAYVLVASPGTDKLVPIESPNAAVLASNEMTETLSLAKLDGEGTIASRQTWHGVQAEWLRMMFERVPKQQIVRWLTDEMGGRYTGARMIGEPVVSDDLRNNVFTVETTFAVPGIAKEQEGNWFIRFSAPNMKGTLAPSPSSSRRMPLAMPRFPLRAAYTFEARLPEDVSNIADPRTATVKNKHFTFSHAASFRGNRFKSRLELNTLTPEIEPADFAAYTDAAQEAGKAGMGIVFIAKSAILSADNNRSTDLSDRLVAQNREIIDKSTKAIASGQLAGKELADTYCLRSYSHSNLGMTDKAVADGNAAIAALPAALGCRGYAYMASSQFEKAIADFSKVIATEGDSSGKFHERGIARLYAGQFEAARQDFAKGAETDDPEKRVVMELWLAFALQRLGHALPDDVRKRAAADAGGEWPRAALAMMAGAIEPADVIKAMEQKSGDDLRMARSEGYFFIGQYYLGRGDPAQARLYFEKSRAEKVVIYLEHIASAFELRRLSRAAGGNSAKARAGAKAKGKAPRIEENAWSSGVMGAQ